MFSHFTQKRIKTSDASIFTLIGGSGPPLLLLHGYPQNHFAWHAVAPLLQEQFTLIIPDLRGYGQSKGPCPDQNHRNYSKRVMAEDMITVMFELGYKRFNLAGHDRGGRVAYRLALDHPDCIERLAVLDIIPTIDVWERMKMQSSLSTYHWSFLAQPSPLPEHMISKDPEFFIEHLLKKWVGHKNALNPIAVNHYKESFCSPSTIEASCEDYRAGATVDFLDDQLDRERGKLINCPTLVVWGNQYMSESPIATWQHWSNNIHGIELDCGHFISEEEPSACATALASHFLK